MILKYKKCSREPLKKLDSLKSEGIRVQIQRRPVADTHVQRDVFGVERLDHGPGRLIHQLLSDAEASKRSLHSLKENPNFYQKLITITHVPKT